MQLSTEGLVLKPQDAVDFQMHTIYSDGLWQPEALIDHLAANGFALAAITDHDRIDTAAHLQELARQKNMPLLVAAELTTEWEEEPVDVLCYGFDPENAALKELLGSILERRWQNIRDVYDTIVREGYAFPRQAEILRDSNGEVLMMRHILILLQEHGYVNDEKSAAQIVLDAGFYEPAHETAVAIEAIHNAGGVCLIAHPGRAAVNLFDITKLERLRKEAPFDGLEVYYPVHTEEQTEAFRQYAEEHNLLMSSGSDSHEPVKLPIKYPAELSRTLLERLGIQFA